MNKVFSIVLMILLALPISVSAVENTVDTDSNASKIEQANKFDDEVIENEDNDIQYKQPVSKRKIAKKFLLAMAGVGISSLLLFFLLTIYNKARECYLNKQNVFDEKMSLESPDDIDEAVKNFINKTDWN